MQKAGHYKHRAADCAHTEKSTGNRDTDYESTEPRVRVELHNVNTELTDVK
jgi:hypothetical protein